MQKISKAKGNCRMLATSVPSQEAMNNLRWTWGLHKWGGVPGSKGLGDPSRHIESCWSSGQRLGHPSLHPSSHTQVWEGGGALGATGAALGAGAGRSRTGTARACRCGQKNRVRKDYLQHFPDAFS